MRRYESIHTQAKGQNKDTHECIMDVRRDLTAIGAEIKITEVSYGCMNRYSYSYGLNSWADRYFALS